MVQSVSGDKLLRSVTQINASFYLAYDVCEHPLSVSGSLVN